MEHTKICSNCNRELPESAFRLSRWGRYEAACRECQTAKAQASRRKNGGGKSNHNKMTFPEFEGKEPREVIDMMSRGKAWLEQQGFEIKLSGIYKKVTIKQVKFEV